MISEDNIEHSIQLGDSQPTAVPSDVLSIDNHSQFYGQPEERSPHHSDSSIDASYLSTQDVFYRDDEVLDIFSPNIQNCTIDVNIHNCFDTFEEREGETQAVQEQDILSEVEPTETVGSRRQVVSVGYNIYDIPTDDPIEDHSMEITREDAAATLVQTEVHQKNGIEQNQTDVSQQSNRLMNEAYGHDSNIETSQTSLKNDAFLQVPDFKSRIHKRSSSGKSCRTRKKHSIESTIRCRSFTA